jgi:hypothetical protein
MGRGYGHLNIWGGYRGARDLACVIFGFIQSDLEPTIYRTRSEHANHYTTDTILTKGEILDRWLARNKDNVSEWSDMSTRGLLFQ